MRIVASFLVLLVASPAYADRGSGASFDFGYVRSRVAVTDNTALDGDLARFGIRISMSKHFHFGGEAEEGSLAGTSSLPSGAVARTSDEPMGPLGGNTLGIKAYAGLHTVAGPLMFSADAALGLRDSWVSSDLGPDVAGRKGEPLLELRSRVDMFVTRSMTVGAVASTDTLERRNVSLAAVLSLNFTR